MESHQDFQNLKAKFQGPQPGFSELLKKPPLPKGSQLPGPGRAHPVPASSPTVRAPDTYQRKPPWQRQGEEAPPSPWPPNLGRGSQASPRTREVPRDQQPPWRIAGNAGEKPSSSQTSTSLGSPRTPRKEQGQGVPRRRPLPPLKTLGPQPPKPPLPPGTLNLEQFKRTKTTHTRTAGKKTVLDGRTQVTALCKSVSFSSRSCLESPVPPIPQNQEEIYDDVESISHCPPSPKRRGDDLLVAERTLKDFQPPGMQLWNSWKSSEEDKVEEISKALKPLKQCKKEEKAEREFRKKFKFEGDIVTLTRMMIDPNANTRRGGGRNLAIRRGEIVDVIQFTSREQILCRDVRGKYGFIPRTALLPLETEVYDDVSF